MFLKQKFRIGIVFALFIGYGFNSTCSNNDDLRQYLSGRVNFVDSQAQFEPVIMEAGNRKLVLLGESTHGTVEFYEIRSEISRRLISGEDFSFIAVEGDWETIYRLNKYIKGSDNYGLSASEVLKTFSRWPEWMWANRTVEELAEWLREYNGQFSDNANMVGFYGIDVYGNWEAFDFLEEYAKQYLPELYTEIADKMSCYSRFNGDDWSYASAFVQTGESCKNELDQVVQLIKSKKERVISENPENYFRALQNAYVIKSAEEFFRLAVSDDNESWNSRAMYMWKTTERLLEKYGANSKGIVWAHNTHVGDARETSMAFHDLVNIGMLSRDQLGRENVFITGFGTNRGEVNAGVSWGSNMHKMRIPQGVAGSFENILSSLNHNMLYILFNDEDRSNQWFNDYINHRAIGVVYNPLREVGNYVPSIIPRRYDAFIYIEETNALTPIE